LPGIINRLLNNNEEQEQSELNNRIQFLLSESVKNGRFTEDQLPSFIEFTKKAAVKNPDQLNLLTTIFSTIFSIQKIGIRIFPSPRDIQISPLYFFAEDNPDSFVEFLEKLIASENEDIFKSLKAFLLEEDILNRTPLERFFVFHPGMIPKFLALFDFNKKLQKKLLVDLMTKKVSLKNEGQSSLSSTCFHCAALRNPETIPQLTTKFLTDNDTDLLGTLLSQKDKYDRTPMHHAAFSDSNFFGKFISKFDLNDGGHLTFLKSCLLNQDIDGDTPLHMSVINYPISICDFVRNFDLQNVNHLNLLVVHLCLLTRKNNSGETPLQKLFDNKKNPKVLQEFLQLFDLNNPLQHCLLKGLVDSCSAIKEAIGVKLAAIIKQQEQQVDTALYGQFMPPSSLVAAPPHTSSRPSSPPLSPRSPGARGPG